LTDNLVVGAHLQEGVDQHESDTGPQHPETRGSLAVDGVGT
jgi:hypothetical protein